MTEDNFRCIKCQTNNLESSEVVTLKCQHTYCWKCLDEYIQNHMNAKIKCPNDNCENFISDSVVRQTLPEHKIDEYEKKSLESIVNNQNNCFKCLLPECENFVFFTQKDIQFECKICTLFNCIACSGSHPFLSCKDYQAIKNSNDQIKLKSIEDVERNRAKIVLLDVKRAQFILESERLELNNNVPNDESFNCTICLKVVPKGEGIKLRSCYHTFCKICLRDGIKNSSTIPVICLEGSCKCKIQDREIRGILNEKENEIFQDKTLMVAKSKLSNVFHCKKPDCKFFGILGNSKIKNFACPSCKSINCIKCNVIHTTGTNCELFQDSLLEGTSIDLRSIAYIENEIRIGHCMKCTKCGCIVQKSGGCNWIKCPQCKLELCWILKIPRWGPNGSGDNSGGCRCGINNIPCDPSCTLGCIPDQ